MATVATISVNFAQYDTTSFTPAGVIDRSINPKTLSQYCLGSSSADGGYIGGFVKKTGDIMSGPLTLPSIDPATNDQAARKLYVDSRINSLSSTVSDMGTGGFVKIAGSTMIGNLVLNTSIPTVTLQAASKGYVDTRIDSLSSTVNTRLTNDYLLKSGGIMTGNITMGTNRITGLPTLASSFSDSDAVSKKYVDDALSGGTSGVATKSYVDQQDNLRVLKTGDTMSGVLNLAPAGLGTSTKITISTTTNSGFYQTNTATTAQGWPTTTNSTYLLINSAVYDPAAVNPLYYSIQFAGNPTNSNEIYYRATNNNGNAAWNKVWHAGNITPASTADLAAVQASATAANTNANTRVLKAGDTMTGPLVVQSTITATGDITAFSDETLKENIETITQSLEKVLKMRGVGFNRKDIVGQENKKFIGVIAQEIEKILPEVVSENKEGLKSVAYGNIVAVLIEAIKELNAKVEKLEAKA